MENIQNQSAVLSPPLTLKPVKEEAVIYNNKTSLKAEQRVSDYRLALGWFMIGLWLSALVALNWDIQWHVIVGRDGFWTPPHWMFYSSVTAAGVICLAVVLLETFLFHRGFAGISERNTTPVLFVFRGPIGFILAGFGMVVMISSAPLDDYWHQIFGIDLAVWTPFHVMLIIGLLMGNIGIVYAFASEMNRRKRWQEPNGEALNLSAPQRFIFSLRDLGRPATLGLAVATASLIATYWLFMEPTFPEGKIPFAGLVLPSYSVAVAVVPFLLVAIINATGRIGTATLVGLIFLVIRFAGDYFMAWGIQYLAVDQGVSIRSNAAVDIHVMTLVYPTYLFLAGLIIDFFYFVGRRFLTSGAKLPCWSLAISASLAAGLVLFLLEKPWVAYNAVLGKNIFAISRQFKPDYWQALPLVMLVAALAGLVGLAVATALRYTDR